MPPLSKTLKGVSKTYGRSFKLVQEFQSSLLDSQLDNGRNVLRDVRLITGEGGWIDVHCPLLASLSPFLDKCIKSQGECYLSRRTILLPDFTLTEIKPLIQLLYTGSVQLGSENQVNNLRGLLAFFEIDIQSNLSTTKVAKGGVAATANKKPDIRFHLKKKTQQKGSSASNFCQVDKYIANAASQIISQSPTSTPVVLSHPILRKRKENRRYNDSDWEPDTDEDEKEDESIQPVIVISPPSSKVPKLTVNCNSNNNVATIVPCNTSTSVAVVAIVPNNNQHQPIGNIDNAHKTGPNPTPKGKNNLSTLDDNKDKEVNYKDKDWFYEQAKKCQFCKKEHEGPAAASLCITGHGKLRCYFCFKVCSNTENLFEHFRKSHKQAGRENCLLCPYCDQTVPFKSVSCHVISLHLTESKDNGENNDKTATNSGSSPGEVTIYPNREPGRPPTMSVRIDPVVLLSKTPDPQKGANNQRTQLTMNENGDGTVTNKKSEQKVLYTIDKDGKIRPKNLDVTIQTMKVLDGKISKWQIQKVYSQEGKWQN